MNLFDKISVLKKENQGFVIATVIKTEGSVPGKVGFKILVDGSGLTFGTVGGGAIENRVIEECKNRLNGGESGIDEYILQEKTSQKKSTETTKIIPMLCNGKVWIYYEIHQSLLEVYIFGGGHVGQALSYFLAKLNFKTILIDNRKEFTSKEKNPFANQLIASDYIKFAQEFTPPEHAFVVIMTHGHGHDYDILRVLYQRKLSLKYIGIIASKSKAKELIKKLKEDFGSDLDISNLHTPIGLDIGGNTESEIALSIAAEIQSIQFNKNFPHIKPK